MGLFDMLANLFNSEEYKKNPVSQNLTDGQLAAINIGAINAEQTGYFCDSMKTGADISEIKENLENYYGITDSFSAVDTLDWLLEKGHRVYFDIIKGLASGKATGIDGSVPESREKERINEYISNLEDTLDELVEENFLSQKSALANCSIAAWDMGRMVTVARCCCDAGYISEEKAWNYINNAHIVSKKQYGSWKEFACGYIIGRAMWSGSNMSLNGIMAIAEGLLQDDESPWCKSNSDIVFGSVRGNDGIFY